ncbi:MAG: Stk1 family PASTA domain-containing Ser/Thr kinase [Acidimicrobiales bacterium]
MADREPVVLNGRYELHSRIARGGMAEVYLARDQLLDRPVAIKVLFPEFAVDPSFVERFRREAQAAANLNHPAIVGVYDWGSYEGTYFIVMEYVRGRALAEILRAEGTLHPDRAADIATDIAGALSFAHRNGVVHRDIKPGNVLISPQGQVKVTDFGIARAMTASSNENLTQTGSVMGTATYFSPEQAQGHAVDPRSDLYSLGVMLYEMLVGRPPFSGDGPVAIAYKHVQEAPVPLRQINPMVPAELEAICMKLLAKNPINRYASAEELRGDLRRYREGQPVQAEGVLDPNAVAATSAVPGLAAAATAAAIPAGAGAARPVAAGRSNPYGQLRTGEGTVVMPGVPADAPGYEPPRRNWVFVAVLVGLLIVLVGLLAALARVLTGEDGAPTDEPETITLDNYVDMDVATAKQALESLGFVVVTEPVVNIAKPANTVVKQDPIAWFKLEKGRTVTLQFAAVETTAPVPEVTGRTEEEARRLLEQAGFTQVTITKQASEEPLGKVLSQNPPGNQTVEKTTVVALVVSEGPQAVPIPDVRNKSCDDARKALVAAGFAEAKVSCVDTPSADVDKGKAIGTDPSGQATKDTDIKVLVSSGPARVKVPAVEGLTQSSAESQLLAAGLQVKVEFEPNADRVDKVISQDPDGGSEVDVNSTVTIKVGTTPPTTTSTTRPGNTSSSSSTSSSTSTTSGGGD